LIRFFAWLAWLTLAVNGHAGAQSAPASPATPIAQVLVMLHLPAPHYRPNSGYAGAYTDTAGQQARRREASSIAHQYGLKVVNSWPMPALGVDCFVMQLTPSQVLTDVVRRISGDSRVDWAQAVQTFQAMSLGDPLYATQPAATRWHLRQLHRETTGRGIRIAIVDSGVDIHHPDLQDQILDWRNFVDSRALVAEAHGTEVAGIIAARAGNGIGISGVAPDAKLLALRACWQDPDRKTACNSFTLAKAMQFAVDARVQIINLSLAGPPDRLLSRFVDVALNDNIAVVAATDPKLPGGGFPASHIGVVAVNDRHSHGAALTGSRDSGHVELTAPGRDIPTTIPGNGWNFVSGSSFAAANVSGLIALVRQLAPKARMGNMAAWVVHPGGNPGLGGTIDVCATLRMHSPASSCFHPLDQAMRGSW